MKMAPAPLRRRPWERTFERGLAAVSCLAAIASAYAGREEWISLFGTCALLLIADTYWP